MQISQVGQYNKNSGQAVGTPVPTTAVTNLTASVRELMAGSIFEGNISFVKGQNVILSLENGQNIHARLDKNAAKLSAGQSMFFQVKSNEGGVVAIRPYMGSGTANPTLMRALQAAGLPMNERNLSMVNEMMKQQLPIHAEALTDMHRIVVSNENIRVDTLVQMKKLDLPITPPLAEQFESYQDDTHELLTQLHTLADELPQLLESSDMDTTALVETNTQLLKIFTDGLQEENETLAPIDPQQQGESVSGAVSAQQETVSLTDSQATLPSLGTDADDAGVGLFFDSEAGDSEASPLVHFASNQLGAVLDSDTVESFSDLLRSIGELAENEMVFDEDGDLNLDLTAKKLLTIIDDELQAGLPGGSFEAEDVRELFSHEGYRKLLGSMAQEQWTLTPSEVKSKDRVEKLYERLGQQMERLSGLLRENAQEHTQLSHTVTQVRDNMDFMHQINQLYSYVQLPLKLSGQDANGELYVYTNKRSMKETDGELSAFLHLDMEHLGSTDVMVRMKNRAVKTNFTFSDDESYTLVEKYLPILQAKLSALGYDVTLTVGASGERVDSMEDFLKRELSGTKNVGTVHRYSFDVRA